MWKYYAAKVEPIDVVVPQQSHVIHTFGPNLTKKWTTKALLFWRLEPGHQPLKEWITVGSLQLIEPNKSRWRDFEKTTVHGCFLINIISQNFHIRKILSLN